MSEVAKTLTDDDLRAFGDWVSKLPPPKPPSTPPDAARVARGAALTRRHPCGVCHNPDFSGREQMPRLAGQREDYLLEALTGYRDGKRSAADTTMTEVLGGTSDADLRALAHFLSRSP